MKKILILGADGLIGSALYERLENKGLSVEGTSNLEDSKHTFLDVTDEDSIKNITWENYDLIYYCIGSINYENKINSLITNIKVNAIGPLKIIEKLKPNQKFIYLSTYVTQYGFVNHNSYSFSKLVLEKLVKINKEDHDIKVVRIPGIYSSKREKGFISILKESFKQNKKFTLDFEPIFWHTMKLERVIDILQIFLEKEVHEKVINIGYPLVAQPEEIIKFFKDYFKREIPIIRERSGKNKYKPDIKILLNYYNITEKDFYDDLKIYLEGEQ